MTIRTGSLGARGLLLIIGIICFVVAALDIDVSNLGWDGGPNPVDQPKG